MKFGGLSPLRTQVHCCISNAACALLLPET